MNMIEHFFWKHGNDYSDWAWKKKVFKNGGDQKAPSEFFQPIVPQKNKSGGNCNDL